MDAINEELGLVRRGELMDTMTEVENMTKGSLGILKQLLYPDPQFILG